MDGLRPCPFCGNTKVCLFRCEYDKTLWYILCGKCHTEFTARRSYDELRRTKDNHDRVIAAWNTRYDDNESDYTPG